MRFVKILAFSFVVALVAWGFSGSIMGPQAISRAAGDLIKDDGCVRQGVEAGCLILKTFDEKKTYNLFFPSGKKPEPGAAISFEGVKHDGPTTCMEGTPVDVKTWVRIKRLCPRESPRGMEKGVPAEEKVLVEVQEVTVQKVEGNHFRISAKGTVPTSGWVVNLHPVIYIRPPEAWEIEAIGIKPTGVVSEVITKWDASIQMSFSKETKSVSVNSMKKPVPW